MEIINSSIVQTTGVNDDGQSRQVVIDKYINDLDYLAMEHEPDNKKDKNAIIVYVEPENDLRIKVGYINPVLAPRIIEFWKEDKIVVCMVTRVTGRGSDLLGIDVEISATTSEELKKQSEELNAQRKKEYEKKRYGMGKWRAIIGVFCLLIAIIAFTLVAEDPSILIMAFIFFIPAIILLLPWERWAFDKLSKMIKKS